MVLPDCGPITKEHEGPEDSFISISQSRDLVKKAILAQSSERHYDSRCTCRLSGLTQDVLKQSKGGGMVGLDGFPGNAAHTTLEFAHRAGHLHDRLQEIPSGHQIGF
jgi:hypothetical protein